MIHRWLITFAAGILLTISNYSPAGAESLFYYTQYLKGEDWTKERLLIQRDGPYLKQEWGLKNRFPIPWGMAFRFDVRVRCSVCSFSDPPEEISYEVALSRVNWNFLFLEAKHGRLHNLSRADTGSYKGFGNYYTGLTIGFYLWRENNKK